ncbi:MAG: thiosulfate oxidation carrier protein SoxY [Gammaproteobacteria bacterium]|nr:thiosulfate oxidation carrier protein SoxY [Gammaproteobacteria bacterium]
MTVHRHPGLPRRAVIQGLAAGLTLLVMPRVTAGLDAALQARFGERRPANGGVELEVSSLVENGNSVAVTVRADPSQPAPTALHLFMPRNPEPWGTSFNIQPPALAEFSTRIRLSGTQDLMAVAEWADGRLGATAVSVMVTLGACADEIYGEF